MEFFIELVDMILPLLFIGAIVVFIIKRLEYKHRQGKLGKKNSKPAQILLDSLMPLGLLFGSTVGIIISMFLSISLAIALSLGSAIGLLLGYFAYELYGNKERYS